MKFQILNTENVPMTMEELDRMASEQFGVEFDEKNYAHPEGRPGFDWFNWIGHSIASLPKGKHEWSEVIGYMFQIASISNTSSKEFYYDLDRLAPLIDLVLHWKKMGFTPVSV